MADPELFERARPRLLGVAYRMLGTVADAEDIVQEAWLRWQSSEVTPERPDAWLTTVTARLALDVLRSAQHRRESYTGPWLPEPVTTEPEPDEMAIRAESLTLGFLAVLESLSPIERVVFLLADVFALPYAQIALTADRSEVACRQIASRARRRLRDARPSRGDNRTTAAPSEVQWHLVDTFTHALATGDIAGALRCLAPDSVLVSDGGAQRHAARRPVVGPQRIVRFLSNLAQRSAGAYDVAPAVLNGWPGLVFRAAGVADLAVAFEVDDRRVQAIYLVNNPDKLGHLDGTWPVA
jgi:RNA polymerase sigma-70 factor (ECF subfamily)